MLGGAIGFFLSEDYIALIGAASTVVCLASTAFATFLFVRYANRYTNANSKSNA